MQPIAIPDELVTEGTKKYTIKAPADMPECQPVEALGGITDKGVTLTMLVALEPGDLTRLAAMGTPAMWLTMHTPQIPPFAVEVADGQGWDDEPATSSQWREKLRRAEAEAVRLRAEIDQLTAELVNRPLPSGGGGCSTVEL